MTEKRILKHPILPIPERKPVDFTFDGKKLRCFEGEVISSALISNGIDIFGNHPKDHSPQGIFCANGQCSQCMVIANGKPVKGCMTKIKDGMVVESVKGLPELPSEDTPLDIEFHIDEIETDVLILGGGPAGLSAAITLSKKGVERILLVDDKDRLGGKLVLQTHKFFGSQEDCYAGTRGIDIAEILANDVHEHNIEYWLNSTALAVFSDQKVGILKDGETYILVKPKKLLVATGAREKNLIFPGNTLPGVYGAGAFQTLVNRDLISPCEKLFIVGGGNVGLIAGYHALQAGIPVVGLVEALPKCGGYRVHEDKLRRSGVPIYTSHTILSANGKDRVESVTVSSIDEKFKSLPETEKTYACDTVLIAVGLDPVDEFYRKAKKYGIDTWAAGDAQEIAEASAAMFSGKIQALEIAKSLGIDTEPVPAELTKMLNVLKQPGGEILPPEIPEKEEGVFPVFHCTQKIPCNPCTSVCPKDQIETEEGDIVNLPYFKDDDECTGCGRCVSVCPGLAITLVDYRKSLNDPTVTLPFEMECEELKVGDSVTVADRNNEIIGNFEIKRIRTMKKYPKTHLISIQIPKEYAKSAAGIVVQEDWEITRPMEEIQKVGVPDEAIVCRCERVSAGEIREWIRRGIYDINQFKATMRAGSGACGAKTCANLIMWIFREEGVPLEEVTPGTLRPLFVEVPLGTLSGMKSEEK